MKRGDCSDEKVDLTCRSSGQICRPASSQPDAVQSPGLPSHILPLGSVTLPFGLCEAVGEVRGESNQRPCPATNVSKEMAVKQSRLEQIVSFNAPQLVPVRLSKTILTTTRLDTFPSKDSQSKEPIYVIDNESNQLPTESETARLLLMADQIQQQEESKEKSPLLSEKEIYQSLPLLPKRERQRRDCGKSVEPDVQDQEPYKSSSAPADKSGLQARHTPFYHKWTCPKLDDITGSGFCTSEEDVKSHEERHSEATRVNAGHVDLSDPTEKESCIKAQSAVPFRSPHRKYSSLEERSDKASAEEIFPIDLESSPLNSPNERGARRVQSPGRLLPKSEEGGIGSLTESISGQ